MSIFLVGLSEAFCRSLMHYLEREPGVSLVGAAPGLAVAAILIPKLKPDVALLDWAVFSPADRHLVQSLRLDHPDLRILCLADEPEAYRAAATLAGADEVVSKYDFAGQFESLLHDFFPERVPAPSGGIQ